jgi:HK97 family phage prohead protease
MKPDETRDQLRQVRSVPTKFETREDDNGQLVISGYFSVFNSIYEIGPGMSESVAPGTFLSSLSGDVRALTNHDSTLVLGRTTAGTLKLREDDVGLWGDVIINPKDSDAMNTYERVKRGDVSQCSFGFRITKEDTDVKDDGSVHWTIREVELYEVSVCTFPAYEATNVQARSEQLAEIRAREFDAWKENMMRRIQSWH